MFATVKECYVAGTLAQLGSLVHILVVNFGVTNNIMCYLVHMLRLDVTIVQWDGDSTDDRFDGLFLSNGAGDPKMS